MTGRTPTAEQQEAIELFGLGGGLVIRALAGTGKTTTLAMCAETTPRTATYLAFNNAIANDARRAFPMTVDTRTVHSVAMAGVRRSPMYPDAHRMLERLRHPRVAPWTAAKRLGIRGGIAISIPQAIGAPRIKVMQPAWQASHVMRALTVFCQSADPIPSRRHFPYVEGLDPRGPDGEVTFTRNRALAAELEPYLAKAWDDVCSPDGELRYSHDVYVKQAQLARVEIPGEYLLMDEAQDLSGVMIEWLGQHSGVPVVWVGDGYQQLYEWRGAVNALDRLDPTLPQTPLTQSWRFGQGVADVANLLLDRLHSPERLTGHPGKTTEVSLRPVPARRVSAVLCRTNAVAVQRVLDFQALGLTPALVGGAQEIVYFAENAQKLMDGDRSFHPDLACFDSWRQVQEYVDTDPAGSDLATLVGLMDRYSPALVIEALGDLESESRADVVVSTAHKAKGREWPVVALAADFEGTDEGAAALAAPELRLLYVACTRATEVLDVSACGAVRKIMENGA